MARTRATAREKKYWETIGRAMEEKHRMRRPHTFDEVIDFLSVVPVFGSHEKKRPCPPDALSLYKRARRLGLMA